MDKNRWGLNKSQRMQIKAFICLLGLGLIVVLLLAKLVLIWLRGPKGDEPTAPYIHIPVIELLTNVWIMEEGEEGLKIFRDGVCEDYPWGEISAGNGERAQYRPDSSVREQVADIVLADGGVASVRLKLDKINGKILGADDSFIEVEGYGRLPLAADYKGYRLYDSLAMCACKDLLFGYSFTDLCMEDGQVCAVLMVKEEVMEYIRVLIKASDYSGNFHEAPLLTCDTDYTVVYGPYENQKSERHAAWEELSFGADSAYFETDRIRIVPSVLTGKVVLKNCSRAQGVPSYRGCMELLRTEDGVVLVNEVLLEEYLYSVVPSEMPRTYPAEALKAQAVSARTYAYSSMEHAGYPGYGAHVDDSTSYQVYNNILEQESTTTAVKDTYGQVLLTDGGVPAESFYYSTSCGVGSDTNVWKTTAAPTLTYIRSKALNRAAMSLAQAGDDAGAVQPGEALMEEEAFRAFITSKNPDDFEASEGWYRWSYQAGQPDRERMLGILQKRYKANKNLVLTWKDNAYVSEEIVSLDDITDIYVEKRGMGGVADELVIETASQKIKVISEYNIRSLLCDGATKVARQDGSRIDSPNLLPSAFFIIDTVKEDGKVTGYTLTGGGFGHGAGMSQNAARHMAEEGYTAREILLYFYERCSIINLYS